jgi:hypothetical protein
MTTTNLLESWHKETLVLSSPFNIGKKLSRQKVSFIYDTLVSFFGLKYFDVKGNVDKPLKKISWLHSLLANNTHIGCVSALYEVALLIEYSKTLENSIQKELRDLKRNPENLRTFFFELYIFNFLDKKNIPNRKKIKLNDQELEGTCILFGNEYLFECRKIFMPKLNEFDVMRRLMTEFWFESKKINKGYGMICTVSLKRPIKGEHYSVFEKKIKKYFADFNEFKETIAKIEYIIEDEFGSFKVIDYDEASLIEIKAAKKYDVLFYVVPPLNPIRNVPNKYDIKITCNFFIFQNALYKKTESVLKEKKDQHKNSVFKNKIFFIDSESFPELQMGLFQNENMFDYNKVKSIYDKLNITNIVCIIRRHYMQETPNVFVDIFYPESLKETALFLKQNLTQ